MAETNAVKWLRAQGCVFDVLEYDYQLIGAEAAAEAVGRPLEMVCKTLLVEGSGKLFAVVVVPGDQRLDSKKLAGALGISRADIASPEVAERITGYRVGGMSPFAARRKLPTFIEESLLVLDRLIVNGGRRGTLIELAAGDLVRLTEATAADLC